MNVRQDIFTTNPPSGMTPVAPGKARIGWAQPDIHSEKVTNSWEDAIANVNDLAPALASLEELIEHPHLDFNVNYRMGFSIPLPNLVQSKQAAQKLYYAALCDLHQGDTTSAALHLRALLAMSQGSADERLIISQLVRYAITAFGTAGTWEFLQSPRATDEQLAEIQSDWSRLEFTLAAENALTMERAMSQMTVEQMRESSAEFRKNAAGFAWPAAGPAPAASGSDWFDQVEQFAKGTWDNTCLKAKETAWRYSWSYTDQLRTLKGNQALIESARMARSNGAFAAALQFQDRQLTSLKIKGDELDGFYAMDGQVDLRSMVSQSLLSLTRFLNKVMALEVSRQMVGTAIALQRYKLAHGSYPAGLTVLVPLFLPALPRDPVDGMPLRYRANSDGTFLLYSVGEDGEDNGGDPKPAKPESKSLYWQRGRDWVWPQPATQQEIEDYYRRELKQAGN